jgi:hypothetical protein
MRMSKELTKVSISPVNGGFQASIELEDGEKAVSTIFPSADEAADWTRKYAEQAGSSDEHMSPDVEATTRQTTSASTEVQDMPLTDDEVEMLEEAGTEEKETTTAPELPETPKVAGDTNSQVNEAREEEDGNSEGSEEAKADADTSQGS